MRDNVCENCGRQGLNSFIDEPHQKLFQCPACGLCQKGVLESESVYEGHYHSGYKARLESKIRSAKIRLGSVQPYLVVETPKTLDIGCSVGATVNAAEQLGWDAFGVDVSEKAVELCRDQGLSCEVLRDGKLPFDDESFDLVTNWQVIEHVLDVKKALCEWKRVLKPGGVMILDTPDAAYWKARILGPKHYRKFWPADHIYTFNRENLTDIIKSCGFEMLPGRLIGRWTTLTPKLTAYALGYRGLRSCQRSLRLCKSIELCCRKPATQNSTRHDYLQTTASATV
ncbi:MAG: class I SAM-dependent methyltransferase [Planctomycetota bacterium]